MNPTSAETSSSRPDEPSRREILQRAIGAGLAGIVSSGTVAEASVKRSAISSDRIRSENAQNGTRDWMLSRTWIDPQTRYRSPRIEGYCNATSIRPGETLDIMVSCNPATSFTIDIYRMGYYGGTGGRLIQSLGQFPGTTQPDPPEGDMRLRDCQWQPATSLTVPDDWLSGVYVGKLTELQDGIQSYVIFIVRDDREADLMFQCSDTTWNAYNRWPDNYALYDNGENSWYLGPGTCTSFNRPYGKYCQVVDSPLTIGSGEFFLWEFPMVYWLEQHGYDVTYISNLDTHTDGSGFQRVQGLLSVGHDEYWSRRMYDHVMTGIRNGLSVGFFSGDTCWGMIDLLADSQGNPNRSMTRVDHFGPVDEELVKHHPSVGEFPHQGPDQAQMIGGRDVYPVSGGAAWICSAEDHWIFAGTGMKNGDRIPGLVGFEWHGAPAGIPGLEVVATGTARTSGAEGTYASTVYPGPRNNIVFNASTIWWADGLAEPPGYIRPATYTEPQGPDKRVQQITHNILQRMCSSQATGP